MQILGLTVLLVMIVLFRDQIAVRTGQLVDSFGDSEDVVVPDETEATQDVDSSSAPSKNSDK